MENMPGCHIFDFSPPYLVYVVNIILVVVVIFCSSVCWARQSAETDGQYLSWETCAAGSPNMCLELLSAHFGNSSTVLRQAFLP